MNSICNYECEESRGFLWNLDKTGRRSSYGISDINVNIPLIHYFDVSHQLQMYFVELHVNHCQKTEIMASETVVPHLWVHNSMTGDSNS